jgi:hypothetical protein
MRGFFVSATEEKTFRTGSETRVWRKQSLGDFINVSVLQ